MVGLGYVVQRYVLRQGRPEAGTAMATAMGTMILAMCVVGIIYKLF
jgi:hypothetical protein